MPKRTLTQFTASELDTVAIELEAHAARLHAVAPKLREGDYDSLGIANASSLARGIRFVNSFVEASNNAYIDRLLPAALREKLE
jgi:hypothetical protein